MKKRKCSYLLVMGHMRSRSSLLTHILLTHPNMLGFGESNAVYESSLKLLYMKAKVFLKNRSTHFFKKIYVDQINHNSKTPNPKIFKKKSLKVIILVRPPDASIDSILNLTKKYYKPWSIKKTVTYYQERIAYLIKFKNKISYRQCLVINSDELVSDPDLVLEKINKFLEVSISLKSEYDTFDFTGISGDPSSNIKTGKIINNSTDVDFNQSKYQKEYKLFNVLIDD